SADQEALNAVFRAAHSIKGSSGVFGFTTVASFTHHLETMLDRLRNHELSMGQAMTDLILESVDVIRAMAEALEDGGEADQDTSDLRARLAAASNSADAAITPEDTAEDEDFGLFADVDNAPDKADEEDDSFGLFAEEQDEATDTEEDDSFGLFTDSEEPEPAPARHAAEAYFNEFFGEPSARGEEPSAVGKEPSAAGKEPSAVGKEPSAAGKEPSASDEKLPADDSQKVPAGEPETSSPDNTKSAEAQAEPAATIDEPSQEDSPLTGEEKKRGYGIYPGAPGAGDSGTPPPEAPSANKSAPRKSGGENSSIRVSVDKVDQLINLVGELVITQSMLMQTGKTLDPSRHEDHLNTLNTLERHTRDLQDGVMSIRLLPVSFLFNRFPRVVRDLARSLNKEIDLQLMGEQTELDKTIIERLNDPLMHLVRNAVDHGIESPEVREAAGKSRQGQVILTAAHEGGNILIEISDDGGGLSREGILKKARSNGLSLADNMSDADVWQLIFAPGFSTAEKVSDVSGRGVGMDVVRRNIVDLGGRIDIESVQGRGSKFSVRLPLTLAILDGMTLAIHDEVFVLPLASVIESFRITPGLVKGVQGDQRVIPMRGEYIPLLDLARDLSLGEPMAEEDSVAVVVESEGRRVAIMVSDLLGQQQVVIKSIEANYRRLPGFSGATIMGDGSVALILDVSYLVHQTEAAEP
ncbi:MAG: chemotaxis protein CheA, partial [Oleiphilaceae bacterium]|nr:chemotaxis protein CheA [Oleiphilaceae bacterium]